MIIGNETLVDWSILITSLGSECFQQNNAFVLPVGLSDVNVVSTDARRGISVVRSQQRCVHYL